MARRQLVGVSLSGSFTALMLVIVAGCGRSPVTSGRIEGVVARTFANLVQLQVSRLGMPPMTASDFGVTASCRKQAGGTSGAGDWQCTLTWYGPQRQTLNDTYDLFVSTDGCYTATAGDDHLGGPVLRSGDGSEVRNLLYAFEGCFDTT
jgi:hypothetical protein